MKVDRSKQTCICKHGKSIHHVRRIDGVFHTACNAPKCKCKSFRPAKS